MTLFRPLLLLIVLLVTQSSTNSARIKGTFPTTLRSLKTWDFQNCLDSPTSITAKRRRFLLPDILGTPDNLSHWASLTPLPLIGTVFLGCASFQGGDKILLTPPRFVIGTNSCWNKEPQSRVYKEGCLCSYLGSSDTGGDTLFGWVLCLDLPKPKGEVLMPFRSRLLAAVFATGNEEVFLPQPLASSPLGSPGAGQRTNSPLSGGAGCCGLNFREPPAAASFSMVHL